MHFTTHAIVLRRLLLRERDCLYHVFSREYGRISVWSRIGRDTPLLDIGTVAEFVLSERTEGRNRSIEHRTDRYIHVERLDYRSLMNILEVLVILTRSLPDGAEYPDLYAEYVLSLDYFERPHHENTKNIALFLLQTARRLGILGERSHRTLPAVERVVQALSLYRLDRLYTATGFTPETVSGVRILAYGSFERYLTR